METSAILYLPWLKRPGLKSGGWPRRRCLRARASPVGFLPVHSFFVLTSAGEQSRPVRRTILTTTKKNLIDRVAEGTGEQQSLVKRVVQQCFDEIIAELAGGNRLEFRDFGVFETKVTPARTAQNPRTQQKVQVPAKRRVVFRAGRAVREQLNINTSR